MFSPTHRDLSSCLASTLPANASIRSTTLKDCPIDTKITIFTSASIYEEPDESCQDPTLPTMSTIIAILTIQSLPTTVSDPIFNILSSPASHQRPTTTTISTPCPRPSRINVFSTPSPSPQLATISSRPSSRSNVTQSIPASLLQLATFWDRLPSCSRLCYQVVGHLKCCKLFNQDCRLRVTSLHGKRENTGLNITCASRVPSGERREPWIRKVRW